MAMTGAGLAERIRSEMGFPTPVSAQLTGWGNGIVQHIQAAALVNNAPGTITGTVPPSGGALIAGAGAGGLISGMSGPTMANLVQSSAGYPFVSSQLSAFCAQIVSHIHTFGIVTFSAGSITGTCTNTPLSPGTLVGGAGTNGVISGLSGPTLAAAIHAAVGYPGGVSTKLTQFCTAITGYIMDNGVAAYASGSVTGTCPAGGGSLANGAGTNGTIS